MAKGLIHIYTGDGKGKTTTSLGLLLRAHGRGFRVVFAQFLKSADTGEMESLKNLPRVTVLRGDLPGGFTWQMGEDDLIKVKKEHDAMLRHAFHLTGDGENTLLILDEAVGSYDKNLLSRELLLTLLKEKPEALEVVLTGRNAAPELLALSDYVSEIKKIKHPFDQGIPARDGIER